MPTIEIPRQAKRLLFDMAHKIRHSRSLKNKTTCKYDEAVATGARLMLRAIFHPDACRALFADYSQVLKTGDESGIFEGQRLDE